MDPTSVSAGASPKTVTRHKVLQVLGAVPVLPGARPLEHSPVSALDKPTQSMDSPTLVLASRWWTAPGTVSSALRYLRAHPPAGLRSIGHGTFSEPGVVVDSLMFSGRSTHAYDQLMLVIAVTRHGHGVALRADAEAVWVPRRTTAELIGTPLTSVDATVTRPGKAPTVRRTVTGHRATSLARVVNHLAVAPPGVRSCPADYGYVDTLVFHVKGPDVVVHADLTGCGDVQVSVGGRSQPSLQGGGAVDAAVVKALNLPAAYGRR